MSRNLKYLLDTNTYSDAIKAKKHRRETREAYIRRHLRLKLVSEIAISSVSVQETERGLAIGNLDKKRQREVRSFIQRYTVIALEKDAAMIAGQIEARLGHRKGNYADSLQKDIQIAAIAIANRLTLVTANIKDFEKIQRVYPELKIEDWTKPISMKDFIYGKVELTSIPFQLLALIWCAIIAFIPFIEKWGKSDLSYLAEYIAFLLLIACILGVLFGLTVVGISMLWLKIDDRRQSFI